MLLLGLCGNSLGLLIGSILTDAKTVSTASSSVILPFALFSGFFKNSANLPVWIGWIQYISPFKYGFTAMILNETKYKPSFVNQLNLDVDFWTAIGLLFVLAVSFRALSLFFLWLLRAKQQ